VRKQHIDIVTTANSLTLQGKGIQGERRQVFLRDGEVPSKCA